MAAISTKWTRWLYVAILWAISALMLVWFSWPTAGAASGSAGCRSHPVCLALIDTGTEPTAPI